MADDVPHAGNDKSAIILGHILDNQGIRYRASKTDRFFTWRAHAPPFAIGKGRCNQSCKALADDMLF